MQIGRVRRKLVARIHYVLMLNCVAVSWKSQRQDRVALCTSEAEYMSASQCRQDVQPSGEIPEVGHS